MSALERVPRRHGARRSRKDQDQYNIVQSTTSDARSRHLRTRFLAVPTPPRVITGEIEPPGHPAPAPGGSVRARSRSGPVSGNEVRDWHGGPGQGKRGELI